MSKENQASESHPSPSRCYLAFAAREELLALETQAKEIQAKRDAVIERTICECSHDLEHIRELPWQDKGWLGADRPWLICSRCGLTEEGWGCGYKKLRHAEYKDVPKISSAIWFAMRTRSVFQNGTVV
jgi:hypothetical protein